MVNLKREFYEILQKNELVFDFIQEFALEGLWYWDLENPHRRWLNTKCYWVLGYEADQFPDWQSLLHPADRLLITQWNPDQLDFDQEAIIRYINKKQDIIQVNYRRWIIYNQEGKPIRLIGAQTKWTYQKREAHLQVEQQAVCQNLLENQSIYVIKTDLNGNYTFVNNYFCQVFDLHASDLLGTPSLNTIFPDDHVNCVNAVVQCLENPGRTCKVSLRKPLPNGRLRHTQWEFIAQVSHISKASELLCIGYDITDKVKVEDDLSVLMGKTREALLSIDRKGFVHYVAPSWSRLYGYEVLETIGKTFVSLIHPDDVASWVSVLNEVTESGEGLTVEQRVAHKNGSWVWSAAQVSIDIQKEEIFITLYEINDRKLAQEAHRESEQRFQEIADNVDEVFWIHSAEPFELLYINSAYERMFGKLRPALANDLSAFLEIILEEDRALVIDEFNKYKQGQKVSLQCRLPTGTHKEVRWIQIQTFVTKDSQGVAVRYIGIVNDITSQKEKERVLQQSLKREQELNRLKSQFVSTASHEFRTPLTTIQSSVDLINLYLDLPIANAREPIQNHLAVIQKEITNFSTLLTDMLTIGGIEAGKITFFPQWSDIIPLSEQLISTHFSCRHDRRTVQVLVEGVARPVFIDTKLISHVLINLLSNAFKFSKSDPQLTITFGAEQLTFNVSDQGIGIPSADLSHLFQAFFRGTNTNGIQGTGLGLVIARQFTELHSGTLNVQSEQGKGTVFTVTLPCPPLELINLCTS